MPVFEEVVAGEDDLLTLPMRDADNELHEYVIKPVSGEWWWKFAALNAVMQANAVGELADPKDVALGNQLNSLGSAGLRMLVLGENNVTAMLADGISGADIQRSINTAFAWHASGGDNDAALRVWSGKAPIPSTTSTNTGEAPATRTRASSSGTTSRRKSKPASTPKAAASLGPTYSGTAT